MPSKLCRMAIDWFRYYIVFSKGVSFIFGVVFSQGLVENAVGGVLMSYLADSWKEEHLNKAAAVINVKDGVSSVMVIVAAHISDAYIGRYVMVLLSTAAYITGVVLLWLGEVVLTYRTNVGLFYVAMMLIALGISGRDASLKAFLADQLMELEPNSNIDEERVEARRKVWWHLAWYSGAATSAFAVQHRDSWAYTFMISAITMGVAFLLLWSGTTFYYCKKPTGSPISIVYRVFKAAIFKQHLEYPIRPHQFFNNDGKQLHLLPHLPFFRWLDKAAIVEETSSLSQEEQERKGKICEVAQVSKVKVVLKMVPMWTTFLVYSLVEATGSTFFIEQTTNLNDEIIIGKTFIVPIVTFFVIQSFSSFTISNMYELLVPKLWGGANRPRTMLVRIASGMVCSILCCITAWQVEFHRLHLVRKGRLTDNSDETISMSIFWLTPQFCLLGLMEGLAQEGLQDFFYHHVDDESMRSYGPPFIHCVLGIGKFLSIPFVLVFRSWFKDTLDKSHLDQYYKMLAMLSLVNLCFYWYVSNMYGFNEAPVEEVDLDALLEEGFSSLVTRFHHRSFSWTTGILSSSTCSRYKVGTVILFRSNTFS